MLKRRSVYTLLAFAVIACGSDRPDPGEASWPPTDAWDGARGPFGGDRTSLVVDPRDSNHALTDSVDDSGIWETLDGGQSWKRASPPGAPFANSSTRVDYVTHPKDDSEWVLVTRLNPGPGESCFFQLPLNAPALAPAVELTGWDGGCALTATDPGPERSGRIVTVDLAYRDPGYLERIAKGIYGVSLDGGLTFSRSHIDGTVHLPSALAFAGDGSLLVGSVLNGPSSGFSSLLTAVGVESVVEAIAAYQEGNPFPTSYTDPYGITFAPSLLEVELTSGKIVHQIELPEPVASIATHPALGQTAWLRTRTGLFRSNGVDVVPVPIAVESEVIVPNGKSIRMVGLSVVPNPTSNAETVFVAINGADGSHRGIYRGVIGSDSAWRFERVSAGPKTDFLDWPKASVVVAPSNPLVIYAPYAEDGMLRSSAFGDPGSFESANEGLTGYNIFGVEEDPSDPSRVMGAAQNVIRVNGDRIATSEWGDLFVSLSAPTCNLRGGVEIDPANPDRWLTGAGAGAASCTNGGVWLTEDAGASWTRVLGSGAKAASPQVVALLQHPNDPDWILAASTTYAVAKVDNDPGIFSSVKRGAPGSWKEIVPDGDAWALLPMADGSVLAGGVWGVSRLTRNGDEIGVEVLPGSPLEDPVRAAIVADERVIVGLSSGKLLRKPLAELSLATPWIEVTDLGTAISDLAVHPTRPREVFVATDGGFARQNYSGIWHSTDAGDSFTAYSEGLESSELCVFDLEMSALGDRLYAGTLGGLVVRSVN